MKWIFPALMAFPAYAEDYPSRIERIGQIGWDSVEIVQTEPYRGVVSYTNSADQSSAAGKVTIQSGEIIVDIEIKIGGVAENEMETAIVQPRGDFIAVPPEVMAHDGETVTVQIMLPMF